MPPRVADATASGLISLAPSAPVTVYQVRANALGQAKLQNVNGLKLRICVESTGASEVQPTQSIWKAPQPGKGQKQHLEGFHPEDFPEGGPYADGKAYFGKERPLAEMYDGYGEGILEVVIPQAVYDARIRPFEDPYISDPRFTEIPIPHSAFDVLNNALRRLHDK